MDLQTARILLDESFTTSIRNGDGRRIFFDPADPTPCWTEKLPNENPENEREGQLDRVQFCLAVGLVCTNVVQTGGGGDNVSGESLGGGLFMMFSKLTVLYFPSSSFSRRNSAANLNPKPSSNS